MAPPIPGGLPGLILVALRLCPALAAAAEGPDIQAVLMLQLINRYRADPPADAERMLQAEDLIMPGLGHTIDQDMFLREMAQVPAAQPVLPDPALAAAARAHADYQRRHRLVGHIESPGTDGFTGHTPPHRGAAAGWRGGFALENCAGPAVDAWAAHVSFVVDWTTGHRDGGGGMQPDRGHRRTLSTPGLTHAGVGLVADPTRQGRFYVTVLFGALREETRRAGGVVFADGDRDGLCDPGEGLADAGVEILDAAGTVVASSRTPGTGAWVLDVPGRQPMTLRITRPDREGQAEILAEAGLPVVPTHWTDTRVIPPAHYVAFDRQALGLATATGTARRRLLAALLKEGDLLPLEGRRLEAMETARRELAEADPALLPLYDDFARRYRTEDHARLEREVAALGLRHRGTAIEAWAREAGLLFAAYRGALGVQEAIARQGPIDVRRMLAYERAAGQWRRITWPSLALLAEEVDRSMRTVQKVVK